MNLLDLLEDPAVFGINKLPPRTTSWPSGKRTLRPEEFLYDLNDWRLTLNANWRFCWRTAPDQLPDGVTAAGFDDRDWPQIQLPANWETLGYGTPLYINSGYAFPPAPPKISAPAPENYTIRREPNPTAVLRRTFEMPADWQGREVILYIGAAQTALMVHCNGDFVGYSEDSMGAAEFDLTPHLRHAGPNQLTLTVCKYSSASYLEDQDCWRLSGIFRDVFLYSRDVRHLADVVVLPDAASGVIRAAVELSPAARAAGCSWHLESDGRGDTTEITIPNHQLWSAEIPVLYPVTAVLTAPDGTRCDIRHFRTGFRTTQITDGVFYLNGQPIKLHGVNRHEFDPARGRAVTREGMRRDIDLIKGAHFDAVRSSHYPNHPLWYELCDRYGLYVCDEANLESHGLSYHRCVLPGDDPAWLPATLDRIRRLVRTNRNHVSITLWSLGNEAGYGSAFEAAAAAIRELDPRPIQYADMNKVAEFDSQTYPPPEWLEQYIRGEAVRKGEQGQISHERQHGPQPTNKPFILNEYAHAMGNSTGNFFEYWETIERHPRLTGGFVWEWCEHGLLKNGIPSYGGDFGDVPNFDNFCLDGLVKGDRTPNPGYFECRHVQQPFAATYDSGANGTVTLRNKSYFRTWHALPVAWQLLRDGHPGAAGMWSVSALPSEAVTFPAPAIPADEAEWYLRLTSPVGTVELPLNTLPQLRSVEPVANPLRVPSATTGMPIPPLWSARPCFDRALTDNDRGCHFPPVAEATGELEWQQLDATRFLVRLRYRLTTEPARVGVLLQLPESLIDQVGWYGRGPHESYCDRKRSAFVGRYTALAESLDIPYTKPQENGQRSDVRELELRAADGSRITITSPTLFHFTLRHYPTEMLREARHAAELRRGGDWYLHLDHMQRGVGGDDSWGRNVHPEYRIKAPATGEAVFFFTFSR